MYDDIVAQFRGDVHQSMRMVEQEVQLLESLECAAALHDTRPHSSGTAAPALTDEQVASMQLLLTRRIRTATSLQVCVCVCVVCVCVNVYVCVCACMSVYVCVCGREREGVWLGGWVSGWVGICVCF